MNPPIQARCAPQALPGEEGALLGGVGSITELCAALGFSMYSRLSEPPSPVPYPTQLFTSLRPTFGMPLCRYSRIFAFFISDAAPMKIPGAHFMLAAFYAMLSFVTSSRNFAVNAAAAAKYL